MKRTVLQHFKQIFKNPHTHKTMQYHYDVSIVRDAEDYMYRIMNMTSYTIWASHKFNTYDEAVKFLENHPHSTHKSTEVILNQSTATEL